jgi:predicted MFS family arabinose efflux permease
MPTEAVAPALASSSGVGASVSTSRMQRAWVAIVLAMVAFLAAVDRNILSILLVPIQKDLHVSDAAMGALTGTAFAFTFAVAGLPLAWLADRTSRRNFIAASVTVWSAMTAVCGLASGYLQLLLARIGVAGGEAAYAPASMSMVGDVFPEAKRGAAVSVLTIGSALGFSVGAYLAGTLNDRFGWHVAMMAVGLPGLIVAAVVWLTVPDPQRSAPSTSAPQPSVAGGVKRLLTLPTLPPLMAATVLLNFAFLGWLGWAPAFLMRAHHLSATNMSAVFGIVVGLGGVISSIVAGVVSDRLSHRGIRWRMYYCVAMVILAAPLLATGLLVHSTPVAISMLTLFSLAAGGLTTVSNVSVLSIAPQGLRATMMALIALAIALLASGLSPVVIGALNDALKPGFGDQAVRYSLLTAPLCLALSGLMFLVASRTIDADAAAAAASHGTT